MATHSSILAWRISWTVGPGELQSMQSQWNFYYYLIIISTIGNENVDFVYQIQDQLKNTLKWNS